MKLAGCHVPNSLGARNESGQMVCSRCGRGMTEDEVRAYKDAQAAPQSPLPPPPGTIPW